MIFLLTNMLFLYQPSHPTMKKLLFLAAFSLFAISTFAQWTPGYFKNHFGANTNDKYIENLSKNAYLTKVMKSGTKTSSLQVRTKIYILQDNAQNPYGMCFELFVNGRTQPINSTAVLDSECLLTVQLSNAQRFTYPVFATARDLRASFTDNKNLVNLLQKETKPFRCTIKIASTTYHFTLNPMGIKQALFKHLPLEPPPPPLENGSAFATPEVKKHTRRDYDEDDLSTFHAIDEQKAVYGVEHMPQFPGGDEEMMKFIRENLVYPSIAAEVGIEGRVTIRFVVDRNGKVTDVTLIRGLDPSCDKEAMRIVKKMPRWIPGRQNGRNVPVYYTLPIMFALKK